MKLLLIGFIYILFSFAYRRKYNPYYGLIFIFIIMALQSNVAGDYMSYMAAYYKVAEQGATESAIRAESGWFNLTRFFSQFISFEVFIILVSLFEYFVLVKFVKRFVTQPFMFAAGLIFFFCSNMMLIQMKAIRQGLAIELIVASFLLIDNKKLIWGVLVAALAPALHTSSLLFMPMLLLFYLYKRVKKFQKEIHVKDFFLPIVVTTAYIITIVNKFLYIDYLKPILMGLDLMDYEGYFTDMQFEEQHFLIYTYGAIAVCVFSYYFKYAIGANRFIVSMAIIGQFAGDFFLGQGSLFRLPLYFSIFSIIAIPNAANFLYAKNHKLLSWLFILLCVGYAWRTFMPWVYRPIQDGFYTYEFIFE